MHAIQGQVGRYNAMQGTRNIFHFLLNSMRSSVYTPLNYKLSIHTSDIIHTTWGPYNTTPCTVLKGTCGSGGGGGG